MARPKKEPSKAGRPSGEKTRCGGLWTEARYRSFVKSLLRQGTMKWGPIQECKKLARVKRGLYECAGCGEHVPPTVKEGRTSKKNIHVDHINPVIPVDTGFTTWDDCVEGMFSELDNLQLLCSACHSKKSGEEVEQRKISKGLRTLHPREESSYRNMMSRCTNPKATGYEHYGGRGIEVCERWNGSFANFLEDMGERPEGTTLERVDVDGDYCKDNCRWATPTEQARNKSDNHYIAYNGEVKTLQEWSEVVNLKPNTILYRLRRGWPVEQALGYSARPTQTKPSRLSEDEWMEVASLRKDGYTTLQLGEMFSIDPSQVSRRTKKYL